MSADTDRPCHAAPAPQPAPATQQKLSRYRSVRKAQAKQQEGAQDVPPPVPEMQESIKRSMSRYRRAPPAGRKKEDVVVPMLPVAREGVSAGGRVQERVGEETRQEGLARRTRGPSSGNGTESKTHGSQSELRERRRVEMSGRNEGEEVLANERARYERIKAQQRVDREEQDKLDEVEKQKLAEEEAALRRAKREQLAEEDLARRRKEAEREREAQEKIEAKQRAREERAPKKRPSDITVPASREGESKAPSSRGSTTSPKSSKRLAGFFRRKKEDDTPRTSMATDERRPKTSSHASPPQPPIWELPTIRPGGGRRVPLNDAPVSGTISAERRVRVACGRSEISLPVGATTSALQLIRSASNVMSEHFNPRAAVMYEHFAVHGLRRPLRMYEHVRTVMNSWENDHQHVLVIEQSDLESDRELYASFAPTQEPRTLTWPLRYEYKPGKWESRWVTLRPDGQLSAAKSESGKDSTTICKLSDFDIYTDIPDKRRKKPKKPILTVKSQQKSAMFLSQEDYMHKFTGDKNHGDDFFKGVQTWRSYYLVNTMGQGQASEGEQSTEGKVHKHTPSADSHYILGTFNNLGLDFESYAKPPERKRSESWDEDRPLNQFGAVLPSAQEHSRTLHTRQLSQRRERSKVPPLSMRPIDSRAGPRDQALNALTGDPRHSSSGSRGSDGAFATGGLLGPQYDQRQRELLRHGAQPSQDLSSSSGANLQRNPSVRSSRSQRRNSFDSATLTRQPSLRNNGAPAFGKPLIDLTPTYKAPPQFQKKGKGVHPDYVPGGGLVDLATTPEVALALNQDWRARPTTSHTTNASGLGRSGSASNGGGVVRVRSVRRPGGVAPPEDADAFTAGGLLARNAQGWNAGHGHGGLGGNVARDLGGQSVFAEGSLLQKVERGGGAGK